MSVLHFGTSIVGSLLGFAAVMTWRVREGRTPVSIAKIIAPPLGMATGFCMFIVPAFRVPWAWAALSFLVGAFILAYPLLRTSRLNIDKEGVVMMQRSMAFYAVILVLAAIRFLARSYFDTFMSVQQTAGLFFILAFGMILRWRLQMYFEYRELTSTSLQPALEE
jgi:membrane protein CcdC involved in cytochrome C biogenesis